MLELQHELKEEKRKSAVPVIFQHKKFDPDVKSSYSDDHLTNVLW